MNEINIYGSFFRSVWYFALFLIISYWTGRIRQQSGNGAKAALVGILDSFSYFLFTLMLASALKTIVQFDTGNLLLVPLAITTISVIRVIRWTRENESRPDKER